MPDFQSRRAAERILLNGEMMRRDAATRALERCCGRFSMRIVLDSRALSSAAQAHARSKPLLLLRRAAPAADDIA